MKRLIIFSLQTCVDENPPRIFLILVSQLTIGRAVSIDLLWVYVSNAYDVVSTSADTTVECKQFVNVSLFIS